MVLKDGKDFEGFSGEEKEGLGFDGKKWNKKSFFLMIIIMIIMIMIMI
jgi:hypothetical protein